MFKSPWKQSSNRDPFISLSNSKNKDRHQNQKSIDRFCSDSLRKNLFHIDKQELNQANMPVGLSDTEKKMKNYRGYLFKACSNQQNQNPKLCSPTYLSKISRPGYIFSEQACHQQAIKNKPRTIQKQPFRILNAPHLKDDFYTNLLDWSPDDIISVVLDKAVYVWSSKQNQTQKLVQGFISSVKWGKGLVIGQQTGKIRLIDIQKKRQTSKHRSHKGRIGTLDCSSNLVISGSKDCNIMIWDVRSRQIVHRWGAHKQQVCGVKISFDGSYVASGGNDNYVSVYDIRAQDFLYKFNDHTAAVKAIAWSPHQNNILSTGGGSTDKCIRVWNLVEGKCINKVDTGSQVCNMMYSINSNQLVSTHGYSMNAINVWDAKDMKTIGTLRGHSYRVLYLAGSPDGQNIVTGSGDQTLRFWKVFPSSSCIYNRISMLQAKNISIR